MDPVSDIASQVDRAFWILGGISMALLAGITIVMIAFVFKYHRSRTRTTRQIKLHLPIELTWTILPIVLVMFMFFVGYKGFKMMRDVPPGARVIKVIAQQWSWSFVYPEYGINSDRLFVPVNEPIRLELATQDVIHSFYLPDFRVKEDAVPGRKTHLWFQAKKLGEYNVFCAEYCGKDHAQMYTVLKVLSQADYEAWVEQKITDKNKPIVIADAMNAESEEIKHRDGHKIFLTYCVSCHGKQGRGGLVEGARDFRQLTGWKKSPKITDIFRTLTKGIKDTQMRSYAHLPAWDRFALAHHVASFSKGPGQPVDTSEDAKQLVKDYDLEKPPPPRRQITIERAMTIIAEEAKRNDTPLP